MLIKNTENFNLFFQVVAAALISFSHVLRPLLAARIRCGLFRSFVFFFASFAEPCTQAHKEKEITSHYRSVYRFNLKSYIFFPLCLHFLRIFFHIDMYSFRALFLLFFNSKSICSFIIVLIFFAYIVSITMLTLQRLASAVAAWRKTEQRRCELWMPWLYVQPGQWLGLKIEMGDKSRNSIFLKIEKRRK